MKRQSGVTLSSVIIYILAMCIIVGLVTAITRYFRNNVIYIQDIGRLSTEYDKFNMFFLEDVKRAGDTNVLIGNSGSEITLQNGVKYSLIENKIYKDAIKVCENVNTLNFKLEEQNGKTIVTVLTVFGQENEMSKTTSYVIRNVR